MAVKIFILCYVYKTNLNAKNTYFPLKYKILNIFGHNFEKNPQLQAQKSRSVFI